MVDAEINFQRSLNRTLLLYVRRTLMPSLNCNCSMISNDFILKLWEKSLQYTYIILKNYFCVFLPLILLYQEYIFSAEKMNQQLGALDAHGLLS